MNRLSAGWGFGAAMCIAAVQGTHPAAWSAVATPGGVRAVVDGVRARTESDSSARKSIVDAILLFDAQYVDKPDWRRIVLAALRESANLRPSGELEVAEKPDHLLLLHRGPQGGENSVSFTLSVTTSSEQVVRYLAQAADFEKKFAHLGVPAIADAFIRGLNDLNGFRKDTSSRAPATGATEEVHANDLGAGRGYVRIERFRDGTADAVVRCVDELSAAGAAGIILDLRGNVGGVFRAAIDVAGLFVAREALIASSEGRLPQWNQRLTGRSTRAFPQLAVVVLVDRATAAGAEMVAGALRDWREAPLVGERTAGNGFIVGGFRLSNDAHLLLPVARWSTPKGVKVDGVGLSPDVAVPGPAGAESSGGDRSRDRQLSRAIDALTRILSSSR